MTFCTMTIDVCQYPNGEEFLRVSLGVIDPDYEAFIDEKDEVSYRVETGHWEGDVLCELYGNFAY